jgi:hypothetical protein
LKIRELIADTYTSEKEFMFWKAVGMTFPKQERGIGFVGILL